MRLVSLLPSATEIVYALGLGEDLAGVTFECDEPPSARQEKAIVVGGLTFAFGEGASKRLMAGILFGVGMAIGAVNFLAWLFPA